MMPKYVVSATKIYQIAVEASNWSEACDKALETPLEKWEDDLEMHVNAEEIEEDK